ncbi:unnamed protein product [Echinostoma caproni]|uniref:GOLGA2L5 domain-containing protein n=1 Tax=Echinostoma caproni TaxID=27848 RepID=A0A183AFD0_9TREM|nr:unnamed protein product [Echinostoma caproni]
MLVWASFLLPESLPSSIFTTIRLENSIRRLRTDVQSMRAVEAQLRGQLTQLERDDRLNRLSLSNRRQENESLASSIAKLTSQTRTERANLANLEQTLNEERRARQQLEEQLVEIVSHKEAESDPSDEPPSSTGHGKAVQVSSDLLGLPDSEPERVIEAPCCQRRHRLESEVYTLRVASRRQDEQLRTLSGARARQANHNHQQQQQQHQQQLNRSSDTVVHHGKHSGSHGDKMRSQLSFPSRDVHVSDSESASGIGDDGMMHSHRDQLMLETYLQLASEERERLANTLREENWMKQELLTAYHTSVREITELNSECYPPLASDTDH